MSNTCEQCGGQRTVYYKIEPVYGNNYTSAALAISPSTMKLCMCPVPRPKHDGKLDEHDEMEVRLDGKYVRLEEPWREILLNPKQALSLLAWLTQERETLERLAEEDKS